MRLQLTRRGDYAIRAMVELARRPTEIQSGVEIARRTGIPDRLVTQVMGRLVKAGMVCARLGRRGGYALCGPANDIAMMAIIEAVEGDRRRVRCVLRDATCGRVSTCSVHAVFEAAQESLIAHLTGASLAGALDESTTGSGEVNA